MLQGEILVICRTFVLLDYLELLVRLKFSGPKLVFHFLRDWCWVLGQERPRISTTFQLLCVRMQCEMLTKLFNICSLCSSSAEIDNEGDTFKSVFVSETFHSFKLLICGPPFCGKTSLIFELVLSFAIDGKHTCDICEPLKIWKTHF